MENGKTRILFIITQSEWGGAQSYVATTAKEALRRGFDIRIAAGGRDKLANTAQESGIRYQELEELKRSISPIQDIKAIKELCRLLKEYRPDILYLHSSKAGIIGSIAGRLCRIPHIVYRIGGWSFLDPVSPIQKQIRIWSERLTAKGKDDIIVLHPNDEQLAKQHHIKPKHAIHCIPNGINIEKTIASAKPSKEARDALISIWSDATKHLSSDPSAPILMTIANFYPTKNLRSYIEAIGIVAKTYPNIRVIIAGEGEERHLLESERAKKNLNQIIALPGQIPSASSYLIGADLFILPSAKEGMPWALLEAMTIGTPSIATDVGANAWMLGENGTIIPPNDPQKLAEAIIDNLDHPDIAKDKALAAQKDVHMRFTEARMMDDTFRILRRQ